LRSSAYEGFHITSKSEPGEDCWQALRHRRMVLIVESGGKCLRAGRYSHVPQSRPGIQELTYGFGVDRSSVEVINTAAGITGNDHSVFVSGDYRMQSIGGGVVDWDAVFHRTGYPNKYRVSCGDFSFK